MPPLLITIPRWLLAGLFAFWSFSDNNKKKQTEIKIGRFPQIQIQVLLSNQTSQATIIIVGFVTFIWLSSTTSVHEASCTNIQQKNVIFKSDNYFLMFLTTSESAKNS